MSTQHARQLSRRRFLGGVTLAGTAGLLGLKPRLVAAEPPPETTTLRLPHFPAICLAPHYVAEPLLRSEGFTDIRYIPVASDIEAAKPLAAGELDFTIHTAGLAAVRLDAGDPLVLLAGLHIGCYELFGTDRVRTIRDLKGTTVALAQPLGSTPHILMATMVAYVGLDPHRDIQWVFHPPAASMQLLAAGQIDAYLAFSPEPQELRAKHIGHVVVNTGTDRPWSQYFCCMVAGRRAFVQQYPVATKRWLRAVLKAADLCAQEPDQAARLLVEKGYTPRYDYALQSLQEIAYPQWREYDPEDSVRFFALRLHEVGMIKSTPQKLIAQGTDWRYLNALKKELKG
jgi:NitT/TauT family transport system substrate-binding protein